MNFCYEPKQGDIKTRRSTAGQIYDYLIHCTEIAEKTGNSFEVKFSKKKKDKSWEQIKGIHLLCTKLIPHLQKEHDAQYSLEDIKDYIKNEFGYMRPSSKFEAALMLKSIGIKLNESDRKKAFAFCKTIKQPKSFAEATWEEMIDLITRVEVWAAEKGWDDVYLESEEIKSMKQFYENK